MVGKNFRSNFTPFVDGLKFMKFCDNVGDPLYLSTPFPIAYVTFRSEDNRH